MASGLRPVRLVEHVADAEIGVDPVSQAGDGFSQLRDVLAYDERLRRVTSPAIQLIIGAIQEDDLPAVPVEQDE